MMEPKEAPLGLMMLNKSHVDVSLNALKGTKVRGPFTIQLQMLIHMYPTFNLSYCCHL